jgi:membrane protease YdiL (CAAX protease family)
MEQDYRLNVGGTRPRLITSVVFLGLALGLIVSPAMAGADGLVLAQVVDTDGVQSKSVSEVLQTMQEWKLVTLGVSMILVIMLLFAGGLLRPGGFAKAGLRDVSLLPSIVWIFGALVVLLAASSAPTLIAKIQWVQQQEYTERQLHAINTVGYYLFGILAGIGMLFVLKRSTTTDKECKAGLGLSILDFPVGLGCFMLAYPFIELMNMLGVLAYTQTQGASPSGMAHPTLEMLTNEPNDPWVLAIVGGAVIGAPFIEELVYRVFLQGAMLKWLKSPWLSIIITSIVFAGMHRLMVPADKAVPWHALLPIFAVGMTCGIAYERTRRVGVPIMMHICFNAMNVILALVISAEASQTGV